MNNTFINKLINYGIKNEMFDILNKDLIINNLLRYFKLDNYTVEVIKEVSLDNILSELSKYYEDNNLLDKDINFDMFSTEVISFITAQPSEVAANCLFEWHVLTSHTSELLCNVEALR